MATSESSSSDIQVRTERLANLVLFLLGSGRPVTIHEICEQVPGYLDGADSATVRQRFERDKRVLREEGIEIAVEEVPNDTQLGYTIREEDWYLPDLRLTLEEQSALAVAATAVHVDDSSSRFALAKLGIGSVGVPPLFADLPGAPHLDRLHEAVRTRAPVSFEYRGTARKVDPYGLMCRGGAWYLFGWDHLRAERRTFRVDRVEGSPSMGKAGSFELPENFDPAAELPPEPWKVGSGGAVKAQVEIEAALAPLVIASVGEEKVVSRGADASVVIELEVVNREAFRTWVLSMGTRARVLGPADLVDFMVEWLKAFDR